MWSNNTYSDSEHRFFILPKSTFNPNNADAQPPYGFFIDQYSSNRGRCGKRENATIDLASGGISITTSQWHNIKYVRDGPTVDIYVDNVLVVTATITWLDNYSDWSVSMTRWRATGTSIIKNVKFMAL